MRRSFVTALLLGSSLTLADPAFAQRAPQPIAPFAIDVRGFSVGLGQDVQTAEDLAVDPTDLPSRALGGVGGVNGYLLRRGKFALGIGGELLIARGRKTQVDAKDVPTGLIVEQRLFSVAPNVSLNFGSRNGWSYLSAGMGPMRFETFKGELPPTEAAPSQVTLNFGGGARWFAANHLAFCFDVRFYRTGAETATELYPGRNANRLIVLSAGISIK